MPPTAYEVYQDLEREEQFAPQDGKTQNSYASWRERATSRSLRRGLVIIGACWIIYFVYLNRLYATWSSPDHSDNGQEAADASAAVTDQDTVGKTIPLDVHIMSKCPDAKDCLQQLVLPAMERISDKVDFQLSFIGRYGIFYLQHQTNAERRR